jgi:hypothetical protein
MNPPKKFWFILAEAILGMVVLACFCGSVTPTVMITPTPTRPMPGLAGNWQEAAKVFTIEWQGAQYVVTAINAAGTSTRTLTGQSWNGTSLTWTYDYSDESGTSTVTYTTVSVDGDVLTANYSTNNGASNVSFLQRVSTPTPSYYPPPYNDDFSNASTGWNIFSSDVDSAGYGDGYYFVISGSNKYSTYGAALRFYGDTVIAVDATPVGGPADNDFSSRVGCRVQANDDGYNFEIKGNGYFGVGYFTGGGKTYTTLLSGDNWQASNAIKRGMAANHMVATCAGSQIKLEVNGQVLFDGQDSAFTQGDISLGAATYADDNTPAEIHFNNLAVTAP